MTPIDISEEQFVARLNQLDGARQFFVQMWRENAGLLKNADPRIVRLMTPIWEHDKLGIAQQASSRTA